LLSCDRKTRGQNSGGDFDNNIYTYSLPFFFAGFGLSSQTQLDIICGLFGRNKDNDKTTHSLSPSSLGLEKFSSQTQPAIISGLATIKIAKKLLIISPSSLGLDPLDTNPARIQPRFFRD